MQACSHHGGAHCCQRQRLQHAFPQADHRADVRIGRQISCKWIFKILCAITLQTLRTDVRRLDVIGIKQQGDLPLCDRATAAVFDPNIGWVLAQFGLNGDRRDFLAAREYFLEPRQQSDAVAWPPLTTPRQPLRRFARPLWPITAREFGNRQRKLPVFLRAIVEAGRNDRLGLFQRRGVVDGKASELSSENGKLDIIELIE